jgi:hypothetical protein
MLSKGGLNALCRFLKRLLDERLRRLGPGATADPGRRLRTQRLQTTFRRVRAHLFGTRLRGSADGSQAKPHLGCDAKTGLLSPGVYFWSDISSPSSVLGDSIFVHYEDPIFFEDCSMGPSPTLLVRCDITMLGVCADYIPTLYIHPSDKYLFLDDQTTNEVPILYISLPLQKLIPSGAAIPGSPSTVAFSPDGLLV